jgi:predicted DNA-binding transcriptional regulator AlpA
MSPAVTARNARIDNQVITDPLSAAITAAVDAALAARLPAIINAIQALAKDKEAPPTAPPDLDRFVPMREVAKALGCVRSTVHRRAAAGVYPKLRKQGGSAGYYVSDLAEIMAKPDQ